MRLQVCLQSQLMPSSAYGLLTGLLLRGQRHSRPQGSHSGPALPGPFCAWPHQSLHPTPPTCTTPNTISRPTSQAIKTLVVDVDTHMAIGKPKPNLTLNPKSTLSYCLFHRLSAKSDLFCCTLNHRCDMPAQTHQRLMSYLIICLERQDHNSMRHPWC